MAYYTVRFNDARTLVCESELPIQPKQAVVVDFEGINEYGVVLHEVKEGEEVRPIIRVATPADEEQNNRMLAFVEQDKKKVSEKVNALGLELKLITVLRSLDAKKILVMYTAADRVDFRQLVRDLAGVFRMRVEMRQVGERDEARFVGGCGPCGQKFCCTRFNGANKMISVKMAKVQGLSLTPNRINGVCGKLMCCLEYEYDQYKDILSKMPALKSEVKTPDGAGVVEYHDYLGEQVAVRFKDGNVQKYPLDKIKFKTQAVLDETDDEELPEEKDE